jgi:hypothetical protein
MELSLTDDDIKQYLVEVFSEIKSTNISAFSQYEYPLLQEIS